MNLTYIIIIILYIVIKSIAEIIQEDRYKNNKVNPMNINNTTEYERNTYVREPELFESTALTRADVEYKETVNKRNEFLKKETEEFALVCPNCGAPLEAIYCECEYCGLSYKEAKDQIIQE